VPAQTRNPAPSPRLSIYTLVWHVHGHVVWPRFEQYSTIFLFDLSSRKPTLLDHSMSIGIGTVRACSSPFSQSHVNNRIHIVYQHLQTTTDNTHDSSALTFDRTGTPAHNVRDLDEHDTVLLITHLVPQHGQPLVYLCSAPTHIAPRFARCVAPTPLGRWGAPSTAPQICS
jgi:hypothetical protein